MEEVDLVEENQKINLIEMDNVFHLKLNHEDKIATKNLVPGIKAYKEKTLSIKDVEYRIWNPFRSKLAAAIMKKLELMPIKKKTSVLYLGASTGTTVSHISDIVGTAGKIFAVEHSSRVAREFINRVAIHRPNIIPIIEDARMPQNYFAIYEKIDVVYADIAQQNQTEIAINNCKMYLKCYGYLLLVIKARSIDVSKRYQEITNLELKKLKCFSVIQKIDLYPYDKDHFIILAKFLQ